MRLLTIIILLASLPCTAQKGNASHPCSYRLSNGVVRIHIRGQRAVPLQDSVRLSDGSVLYANGSVQLTSGIAYRLLAFEAITCNGQLVGVRHQFWLNVHRKVVGGTLKDGVRPIDRDVQLSNGDILQPDGAIVHPNGETEQLTANETISSSGQREPRFTARSGS